MNITTKASILMVVVMLPIVFYLFRRSFSKTPKADEPKVCELLYFYTSWCPYCKKSSVEWNKFKSEWHHKKMDGYELIFKEVDCDINESLATKYNITTYPSIKLIKDESIIDFDAKPTVDTLTRFLMSSFE
jgi:thiol-disulfide isomerase/thioredoxin